MWVLLVSPVVTQTVSTIITMKVKNTACILTSVVDEECRISGASQIWKSIQRQICVEMNSNKYIVNFSLQIQRAVQVNL